jgi:hypothetical protein
VTRDCASGGWVLILGVEASDWASTIRDGLDPDIACFVHDQAAAWHLLANSYAHSARHAETAEGSEAIRMLP